MLIESHALIPCYAKIPQRLNAHHQERLIDTQAGEKRWLMSTKENDRIIGIIGGRCAEDVDMFEIVSVYVTKEKGGQDVADAFDPLPETWA